jgi:hypothetical protein
MSPPSPPADPSLEAATAAAEEVRAYLVALRGGAPFLSGADARLLVGWLDQGVPVPLILSSLDRVAARRQARRVRSRMSLNSARREVEKAWGSPQAVPVNQIAAPAITALDGWLDAVATAGGSVVAGLVTAGRDRIGEGGDVASLVADLSGACRRFHDAQWRSDPDQQRRLEALARDDLADLKDKVNASVFRDLVEESARAQLRARWPLVCAAEVWDRVAVAPAESAP